MMPAHYQFKLLHEARAQTVERDGLIMVFEANEGNITPVQYDVSQINEILESRRYDDIQLSNQIVSKLLDLQGDYHSDNADEDLSQRYRKILLGLSQRAVENLKSPNPGLIVSTKSLQEREKFVSQFYFDWVDYVGKDEKFVPRPEF